MLDTASAPLDRTDSSLERAFQAILVAESTARMEEGGPDAESLATLECLDVATLDEADAVRALQLAHKLTAHVQAICATLAARVGADPGPDDWAREEIGAALNISGYHSNQLLRLGRAFQGELRETGRALSRGGISYQHAVAIEEGVGEVEPALRGRLEETLIARAKVERVGAFRRTVRMETAKADTSTFEERCAQAQRDRKVSIYPEQYAMGTASGYLPAPTLMAFDRYLNGCAELAHPDDERTHDQLRADAFAALISQALAAGGLPEHHGLPVTLNVTMTESSVFGRTDSPADLDGFGPIPASMAREMAAYAQWRALVIDEISGYLRSIASSNYRPGVALQRFLVTRSEECIFPICGRDALLCDLDHVVPYPEGPTEAENMGPECRRHHRCKHGTWTYEQRPDGSGTWTSPLGFRYDTEPRKYALDP